MNIGGGDTGFTTPIGWANYDSFSGLSVVYGAGGPGGQFTNNPSRTRADRVKWLGDAQNAVAGDAPPLGLLHLARAPTNVNQGVDSMSSNSQAI